MASGDDRSLHSESVHDDSVAQSDDEDEPIGISNTLLAYTDYGMSTATPDNLRELLASHFTLDEIIKAKELLWDQCVMLKDDPPKRQNPNQRSVNIAHVVDIVDAMYKADAADKLPNFVVEPQGIPRLPRLNPEKPNVVAIDQRIADLEERNHVLEIQSLVDRIKYLMCIDRLEHVESILQQHTNTLRIVQHKMAASSNNMQHQPISVIPVHTVDSSPMINQTVSCLSTPENLATQLSVTSPGASLHPKNTTTSSFPTFGDTVTGPKHLSNAQSSSPQLTPRQPPGTSGATPGSDKRGTSHGLHSVVDHKSYRDAATSDSRGKSINNQQSVSQQPVHSAQRAIQNVSQSDGYKFCAFSGGSNTNSQHSDDVPPGFTKTHATKNRDRYNEKKRQKIVHGTADSLNCFFHGGKSRTDNLQKFSKCDLFLQHCDHSTTVKLVKHHLRMNSIDTTGIRVDVASKEIAELRSFRMLAPNDLRQTLLQPDLWPEGVRVKDYVIYTKPYKTVSKSKYRGRQY